MNVCMYVNVDGGKAPGTCLLNQFLKRLNYFSLIGQKNILLANQRGGPAG